MRLWQKIGWLALLLAITTSPAWAQGDPNTFSCELTWQDHGASDNLYQSLSNENEPFAVEPDWQGREVFRGNLVFDPPSARNINAALVWDRIEQTLYVDLNQDGDLTNDPNGILKADNVNRYYQHFPAFVIAYTDERGTFRYGLKIDIYDYSGQANKQTNIRILSCYRGTMKLHGVPWQMTVTDRLQANVHSNSPFSLSPTATTDERPEGYATNQISSLALPQSLYVEGHCYDLAFDFRSTDQAFPSLWCTLTEKEIPLGQLDIQGQFIEGLVLGNSNMLVLPPLTDHPVTVPIGNFSVQDLDLKVHPNKPTVSPRSTTDLQVHVKNDEQNVTTLGGPLTSSVSVERIGCILRFNYELCGAGGERYNAQEITDYDSQTTPTVTIYKGKLKLASGSFEYG